MTKCLSVYISQKTVINFVEIEKINVFFFQLNNRSMDFYVHQTKYAQRDKERTTSTLKLFKKNGLFQRNKLKLRCFADITGVYTGSAEYQLYDNRPYLSPITGDASSQSHCKYTYRRKSRFLSPSRIKKRIFIFFFFFSNYCSRGFCENFIYIIYP